MILRKKKGPRNLLNPNPYTQSEDFLFSNFKGFEKNKKK